MASLVSQFSSKLRSLTSVSEMSSPNQLLQNIIDTHENTSELQEPVELGHARSRQDSIFSSQAAETLKRTHWKNMARYEKCSEQQCSKKFSKFDRKRNCAMCGDVFCKNCTRFTRKLSSQAVPDPLGASFHVCHTCLMATVQNMGQEGNWYEYFEFFRDRKMETERQKHAASLSKPLTQVGTLSNSKKERANQELERLKAGYETQSSWMKQFVPDFKVPSWQKSSLWVDSSNAHQCPLCHNTFKKKLGVTKKINCRVCGRVYCTDCISKDELMLFMKSGTKECDWAINGKEGAPVKQPRSFVLLPVCKICEQIMEEMLVEEIEGPLDEELDDTQEDFMDALSNLETTLFKSRLRIESLLPQYLLLVDSIDIIDGALHSTKSKSPIKELARAQSNLSDHFSQLAVDSQKLRLLQPHTPTQEKLLKHVTISIYRFYEEHMHMFKGCRRRLSTTLPTESMEAMQKLVNKFSIERVHIFLRQILYEAMNLDFKYKLACTTILSSLAQFIDTFELQMDDYFTKIGEDWLKHHEAVMHMVREDYDGSNPEGKKIRRICFPSKIPKSPFRHILILKKVLQQCSYCMHESLRELSAKTTDSFFSTSKIEMKKLAVEYDRQVSSLIQKHPQVFLTDSYQRNPPAPH